MTSESAYAPRRPGRRKELSVRGVRYSVTEWGDSSAPLFFFLHGWADTAATFQFVVDALARDWHVVAPDWRGFGHSRTAATSYWFPDYLADLHELLEVYSPGTPARIVGHSMGANVAGLYAGAFPERVRAFVNVEGFGLFDSDPADAPRRYRRWIEEGRDESAFSTFADMGALAAHVARKNPGVTPERADFVARQWGAEQPGGRVALRADPRHKLPNPVLNRRSEAEECWQAITGDVLLVKGSASDAARQFAAIEGSFCPGDDTVCIADAGHMLHLEAPAALAAAIEAFFSNHL